MGDAIRIDGDYAGSGTSVFALDTVLEGDGFASDKLVITGDTSGETMLSLAGLESAGAEGAPLAIDVVSVGGTPNGTFTLMEGNHVTAEGEHGVIAGAHLYTLAKTDGGWALRALTESGEVNYQPSAPIYVSSDFGDGSIDTTGLGLGLAATWYDTRRFYVDGQLNWASYSSDLSADRFGALTEGNGGTGYALSIEAGQQLDLGSRLTVIPQAQLSLSTVAFSDFTGVEDYAERVAFEDASSQQLRLGLEFGAQDPGASGVYGLVNLFHEFGAGSEVDLSGVSLTTESEPWAVGVGVGGRYAWSDRVDLFGEASYATGLSTIGDTSALSANAGIKMVF